MGEKNTLKAAENWYLREVFLLAQSMRQESKPEPYHLGYHKKEKKEKNIKTEKVNS